MFEKDKNESGEARFSTVWEVKLQNVAPHETWDHFHFLLKHIYLEERRGEERGERRRDSIC